MFTRTPRWFASLLALLLVLIPLAGSAQATTVQHVVGSLVFEYDGTEFTVTGNRPYVIDLQELMDLSGYLTGSGTDGHIVRWDSASGTVQDSAVIIADTTGAMLTPTVYVTGTVASPVNGTDTFAALTQGGGFPRLVVGEAANFFQAGAANMGWSQTGGTGLLQLATLTGARAWTCPDLSGTILLDSTAYTDFPAFSNRGRLLGSDDATSDATEIVPGGALEISGTTLDVIPNGLSTGYFANDAVTTAQLADLVSASRIHGSGSGSAAALDLKVERGLDADADGVGIATDGVTTAMIGDRGAASRIIGSGSGGAATIDLLAEDGLDIDADGIGVSAGGILAAMLGDDLNPNLDLATPSGANFTMTTEVAASMTTGASTRSVFLPDPTPGDLAIVIKADSGAGGITVDGNGSDTINGATTVALAATQFKYGVFLAISTSAWIVISSN